MPRRRRDNTRGQVFHVMNRSARRLPLFECHADYEAFERVLAERLLRNEVSVYAYCLMPNHWHLVMSPGADGALSTFMHWVTTTHARRWQLARQASGQGAVYQGRFRAVPVTSDEHFLTVCRYVERNAVRAALVARAEEWRWCSLWWRQAKDDQRWLASWPVPEPVEWVATVNAPQTESELELCRRAAKRRDGMGSATLQISK